MYLQRKLIEPTSNKDEFISQLRSKLPQFTNEEKVFLAFRYAFLCDIPEEQKLPTQIPPNAMSQYVQAKLVVKDYIDGNENTVSAISESLVKSRQNKPGKLNRYPDNKRQKSDIGLANFMI